MEPDKKKSQPEEGKKSRHGKKSNAKSKEDTNRPPPPNEGQHQKTVPVKDASSSDPKYTLAQEDTAGNFKSRRKADLQEKPPVRSAQQKSSSRQEKGRNTSKAKKNTATTTDSNQPSASNDRPLQNTDPARVTSSLPSNQKHKAAEEDTSGGWKYFHKADQQGKPQHRPVQQRKSPRHEKARSTAKPKAQEDTSEGLKVHQKTDRPPLHQSGSPRQEKGRNNAKSKKDTEHTTDPTQPSTSAHTKMTPVHQDGNTGATKVRHKSDLQGKQPLPAQPQSSTGTSKQGTNKTGNTQKRPSSQGCSGMTFPMTYYNSSSKHDLHGNTRPHTQPSTSHGTTSSQGNRDSWSYTPIEIAPRHLALRKYLSGNEGNWNQSATNQSFSYNKNVQNKPNNNTYASHTKMYENTEYKQNKASYPLLPKAKQQEQSSKKGAGDDSKGATYAEVTSRSYGEEESKPTKLKISKHYKHHKIVTSTASKELPEKTSTKVSATASSSADTRTPSVKPSEMPSLPLNLWPHLSERRHVHFSSTTASRAPPEPTEKYRSSLSTVAEAGSLQNSSIGSQENWGLYDSESTHKYNQHVLRPGAFPFYPPHAYSYQYEPTWARPAQIRSLPNLRTSNPVLDWPTWTAQRRANVLDNYYLPSNYSQIMQQYYLMANNQATQYPSTTYYPYQFTNRSSTESIQPIQQPEPAEQTYTDRKPETGSSESSRKSKSKKPACAVPDDDWSITAAFLSNGELLDSTPNSSSATSELNMPLYAGTTNPFDIGLNIDLTKIFETAKKNNSRLQPDQNSEFSLFNDSYKTRPGRFGPGISLADLELSIGWNITNSSTLLSNNRFNRAPGNRQVPWSNVDMYPTANRSRNPPRNSPPLSPLLPTSSTEVLSDDWFNDPSYWEQYFDNLNEPNRNQRRRDESNKDKSNYKRQG